LSNNERELPPEKAELVNRRAFLEVVAGAVVGAAGAGAGAIPEIAAAQNNRSDRGSGPLYMQTNEIQNAIIHYRRGARGALTEVERVLTGGAGSGTFKPISGQENAPNAFEGAGSVILSPDRQLLLTTNGDDNSVFLVRDDGTLGEAKFQDAKAASPFYIAFLHGRPESFVIGHAVGDGCAMATIDGDGKIDVGPLVKIDTGPGLPSELCWLSISPDDRTVYATNFGYSYISSYHIHIAAWKSRRIRHVRRFRATARPELSTPPSPADRAIARFRRMEPISTRSKEMPRHWWATRPDGSLHEITRVKIPYNSPQGLAGF
jgi:hypothetical protein